MYNDLLLREDCSSQELHLSYDSDLKYTITYWSNKKPVRMSDNAIDHKTPEEEKLYLGKLIDLGLPTAAV